MKKIAKFEKVSFEQFKLGFDCNELLIEKYYDDIKLPTRSTAGSAGYDYACPIDIELRPGDSYVVPTGIRCNMDDGWVHMIYPRSGMGFKYRLRLNNTVGIIDSDYYFSDNEGHIMVKLSNEGDKKIFINAGDKFAQGVFVEYGLTVDDDVTSERNGGFGSTGK